MAIDINGAPFAAFQAGKTDYRLTEDDRENLQFIWGYVLQHRVTLGYWVSDLSCTEGKLEYLKDHANQFDEIKAMLFYLRSADVDAFKEDQPFWHSVLQQIVRPMPLSLFPGFLPMEKI